MYIGTHTHTRIQKKMQAYLQHASKNGFLILKVGPDAIDDTGITRETYVGATHIRESIRTCPQWWACMHPPSNTLVCAGGIYSSGHEVAMMCTHKDWTQSGVPELMKGVLAQATGKNARRSTINSGMSDLPPLELISDEMISSPKMSMKFSVLYTQKLASKQVERRPRIHVHFSNDFCDKVGVYDVPPDGNKSVHMKGLKWEGVLLRRYVPDDLVLNLYVFTDVMNDSGQWCGNQAGKAQIPYSEIAKDLFSGSTVFKKKVDMIVASADKYCKGHIEIEIRASDVKFSKDVSMKDDRVLKNRNRNKTIASGELAHKQIISVVDKNFQTFKRIPPTWSAVKNIHAYLWSTQEGIVLPASVFDLPNSKPSPEAYYINILKCVLARYSQSLEWFLHRATDAEVARVVTEMSTVYVNWCKYIADLIYTSVAGDGFSDRNKQMAMQRVKYIESFDCVRARGVESDMFTMRSDNVDASDCEDFAKEILEFFHQIKFGNWTSEPMLKIVANCKLFYNFAVLGGVSNAKLDGHYETMKTMNAHEYVIRVPRYLFWKWMRKGSGDHGDDHPLIQMYYESEKDTGKGLLPLIAEGTGLLYPDETEDASAALHSRLERTYRKVFKRMRKRYTFKRGVNGSFYQTCTTFFTPDFATRGMPYLEFFMCYNNLKKGKGQQLTYCVRFTDISKPAPSIVMIAQPPIMKEDRELIKSYTKDLYPPPVFHPPTKEQKQQVKTSEFVKELGKYMHKEPTKGDTQKYLHDPRAVSMFLRRSDATRKKAKYLCEMLKKEKGKVIISTELINSVGVGGYFITFMF